MALVLVGGSFWNNEWVLRKMLSSIVDKFLVETQSRVGLANVVAKWATESK